MFRIPVVTEGEQGNQHWSHGNQVDPARASRVTHVVCDGKYWYLYEPGDELAPAHTPEQLHRQQDKPAAAAASSPARRRGRDK